MDGKVGGSVVSKGHIGPSMRAADCRQSNADRHSRVLLHEERTFFVLSLSSHGQRCRLLRVGTLLSGICLTSCVKLTKDGFVIVYFLLDGSVALGNSIAILSIG